MGLGLASRMHANLDLRLPAKRLGAIEVNNEKGTCITIGFGRLLEGSGRRRARSTAVSLEFEHHQL